MVETRKMQGVPGLYTIVRETYRDISTLVLVITNLAIIIYAVKDNLSLPTLLWTFYLQSVIMGVFWSVKHYKFLEDKSKRKTFFGAFFANYLIFHIVYLMFLFGFFSHNLDWHFVLFGGGLFLVNHLFSFIYNYRRDGERIKKEGPLTGILARILPMHFSILFFVLVQPLLSFLPKLTLWIFLLLKTYIDIAGHIVEHRES